MRERPRSARSLLTVQDAVRAICVRRAALFEHSEFQHASKWHSRQEEWSTRTRQGPGGRCQPLQKNLSDRRWRPAPLVWEPLARLHFITNHNGPPFGTAPTKKGLIARATSPFFYFFPFFPCFFSKAIMCASWSVWPSASAWAMRATISS